jgi:enoyl-CoA hydratase
VMIPLKEALDEVSHDNDIRVVVLTGAGDGFCSGADLENPGRLPRIEGLTRTTIARRALELLDDVILGVRRMHQPVIAAVNGAAIGGGFCLATACDIRVASEQAYFRAAGINNGLTASELGLSYLLPRAVGSSRAAEIMLTGRDVPAEEAAAIGLVSRVVDDVVAAAVQMGQGIAGWSQPGVELTKRTLVAGLDASSLESHMQAEGLGQLYLRILTDNFEEATRARKENRAPRFRDTR